MSYNFGALDERVQKLLTQFGAAACGAELVCTGDLCGHITAAARIYTPDHARTLWVWSAKNQRWQLPGAHGDNDLNLAKVAHREALRALGLPPETKLIGGQAVGVEAEEVPEYWNTPAHTHLAVIFEFQIHERASLPRGAQWFDSPSDYEITVGNEQ
ncbi:hypothetical protein EON83_03150 [bacterium]|nr:MAG: hypothetical protein EON83_03150 [bacterium]